MITKMIDYNRKFLFRMTHIENIPHILKNGITHTSSPNANKNYIAIGDTSVIETRNNTRSTFGKISDYIPFYFGYRTPMLYVIQNGHNGVTKIDPEKIIYCVSSIQKIIDHNMVFIFTDGHALNHLTTFYHQNDLSQINDLVDFNATKAKFWNTDTDLDLKRKKEAEFLVQNDVIPVDAIIKFVVFNDSAKNTLLKYGVNTDQIVIKKELYF